MIKYVTDRNILLKKFMNKSILSNFKDQKLFELFSKYTLVGIANAVLTFVIYWFLLKIIQKEYKISFTISWLTGVFFTYVVNFLWVFKTEQKLEFKKRLWKYFFVYLVSYLTNILSLHYLVSYFHYDPFILQLIIIPIVFLINFSGIKLWALK